RNSLQGLIIQDTATGGELINIGGDLSGPLVFSPDGKVLAATIYKPPPPDTAGWGEMEAVLLSEVATGKRIIRIETGQIALRACSPDGRILTTADRDALRFWEIATGKECVRRPLHEKVVGQTGYSFVSSLAFFPDGRRLATGLVDSTILIWDVAA